LKGWTSTRHILCGEAAISVRSHEPLAARDTRQRRLRARYHRSRATISRTDVCTSSIRTDVALNPLLSINADAGCQVCSGKSARSHKKAPPGSNPGGAKATTGDIRQPVITGPFCVSAVRLRALRCRRERKLRPFRRQVRPMPRLRRSLHCQP